LYQKVALAVLADVGYTDGGILISGRAFVVGAREKTPMGKIIGAFPSLSPAQSPPAFLITPVESKVKFDAKASVAIVGNLRNGAPTLGVVGSRKIGRLASDAPAPPDRSAFINSRQAHRTSYSKGQPKPPTMRHLCVTAPNFPLTRESKHFQEMFLSSRMKFVRLAHSILRNQEDAEDAVQDAFVSACTHSQSFEGRSAFTTWFTRIVFNAALMFRRKRKHSRLVALPQFCGDKDIPWLEEMPSSQPDPERIYAQKEARELVAVLTGRLKPVLREALSMTYLLEMSSLEAATALGISVTSFKSRVLRARRLTAKRARVALTPPRSTNRKPVVL
jgi:RNA polymerase sigma-70 factor, ECF subfamily